MPTPEERVTASGPGAAAVGGNVGGDVTINNTTNHFHPSEATRPERWLHQLPAPLSEKLFVGRGDERAKLRRILNAAKGGKVALTALRGMGGVGKTALAVFVANQIKDRFPDAQFFIQLHGTTTPTPPSQVMAYVIRAFHPEGRSLPEDADALQLAYRSVLAGKKVLLVLDNAENATQVRPLLPPEGCGLIVTSRASLVSLSEVETLPVGELTEEESVKLLRTLVPTRGTDEEMKLVGKLCGYLPLALNVAGSFLKGHPEWTPAEYIDALKTERLKRLTLGGDETKNVEAVLALSAAQLLRDDARLAADWQLLSVFSADFPDVAAAAVLEVSQGAAKDALTHLVARHLVIFDEGSRLYRLHDLIREIAARVVGADQNGSYHKETDRRLNVASLNWTLYYWKLFKDLNAAKIVTIIESSDMLRFQADLSNFSNATIQASRYADIPKDIISSVHADAQVKLLTAALRYIESSPSDLLGRIARGSIFAEVYNQLSEIQYSFGDLNSAIASAEAAVVAYDRLADPTADAIRLRLEEWRKHLSVS